MWCILFLLCFFSTNVILPTDAILQNDDDVFNFVFTVPPMSLAYGQLSVGLELYRRGHRIIFASLNGFDKIFKAQFDALDLDDNDRLIQPELMMLGEPPVFDPAFLANATADPKFVMSSKKSMLTVYNNHADQFQQIIDGIEKERPMLDSTHPLNAKDTVFVTPGHWKPVIHYTHDRDLPTVIIAPTGFFINMLTLPVYVPKVMSDAPTFNKSLMQRIVSIMQSFLVNCVFGKIISHPIPMMDSDHVFKRPILRIFPTLPQTAGPRAISPLTVYTGPFLSTERANDNLLPDSVRNIIDHYPVIYLSFGTYASLNSTQIDWIVRVSSPHHRQWGVVWALKDEQKARMDPQTLQSIASLGDRFVIAPWISTPAMLSHKNTRLFVSHCGGNGLNEALGSGLPILGIPLFGDQPANCRSMQENLGNVVCLGFGTPIHEARAIVDDVMSRETHAMREAAQKAKVLTLKVYKGVETAADWLETAAALKGDFRSFETPPEREGVVRSYGLDLLLAAVIMLATVNFLVGLCIGIYRTRRYSKAAIKKVD